MKALLIIATTLISLSCFKNNIPKSCDPFAETKKEVDTINVKVELLEWMALPTNLPSLVYLEKKRLVKEKKFNSSIAFKIIGCSKIFNEISSANNKNSLKILRDDYPKEAILKCVVFKDKGIPGLIKGGYLVTIIDVNNTK